MTHVDYCSLIIILCTFIKDCVNARNLSEEETLIKELFDPDLYHKTARPVMSSDNTVSVKIQFSLMHIKELDVRSQVLTTTGLLILMWTDERLQWEPEEYNNLTELIVEGDRLWRPEFAVINGAEKIYETYDNFRAIVKSDGSIRWEPGGVFKTMCQIDITYYPFDHQRCELQFGAWSYHTNKMNLTNLEDKINLDSYKTNGEWQIMTTEVNRREFAYECCPKERFSNIAFVVLMRRRHTFYIMNVILPSILTSILLLSIFFCTPGQKVQIGVVVLLSFRIFLLNVADNIPKTSDHIPLLGIYLTCTMAITTLSMVLTVFILNLHHISDRPVPIWIRKLALVYFAKLVGMCDASKKLKQHDQPDNYREMDLLLTPRKGLFDNVSARKANLLITNGKENGSPIIELQSEMETDFENHGSRCDSLSKQEQLSGYSKLTSELKKSDRSDMYAREWRRVAEVFDRLFFWLFLLAILISTLVLFHPLTDSYLKHPVTIDR